MLIKNPFSVIGYRAVSNLIGKVSFNPYSIFSPISFGLMKGEILFGTKTVMISSRFGSS